MEKALDQMLAGREIIRVIMEGESVRYTLSFRDAELSIPEASSDYSTQKRYKRLVLAYQTALFAAGLPPPQWEPSIGVGSGSLFSDDIIEAMSLDNNPKSDNRTQYHAAKTRLEKAKENNGRITWGELLEVFTALIKLIEDRKSGYENFNTRYITGHRGDSWADDKLRALLQIFTRSNGPRIFQKARDQHNPDEKVDFAEDVLNDLRQGKLVIIDQSGGDPIQNQQAAERIMWRIFHAQEDIFRSRSTMESIEKGATDDHILVYVEEAHNLLPNAHKEDILKTVWARSAKEGSKLNLGMVLATQAPSSIMSEILSETDNLDHILPKFQEECRVVADYMDFEDFTDQINRISEPGYVRIKTLSLAYTVPVQLRKFIIDEMETELQTNSTSRNGPVANNDTLNKHMF